MRKYEAPLLRLAKLLGLFALARLLTRRHVRILAYHGIWLGPTPYRGDTLFMAPSMFHERMDLIERRGYPVVSLDQALAGLAGRGTLPPCPVVLTIDDGWEGVRSVMLPELVFRGFPATLYLDTANVQAGVPIAHVMANYRDRSSPEDARTFRYMLPEHLPEIAAGGIDIQLHTHTHTMHDLDPEDVAVEIDLNRAALSLMTGEDPESFRHLSYPSGRCSRDLEPLLEDMGVASATTVEPGLAKRTDNPYFLPRLLDSGKNPAIVFEAELCGLKSLIRSVLGRRGGYSAVRRSGSPASGLPRSSRQP